MLFLSLFLCYVHSVKRFVSFVHLSSINLELTYSAWYILGGEHSQALAYKWCVLPRNTGVRQGGSNANSPLQLSLRFVETFMTTLLIFPVTEAAVHLFRALSSRNVLLAAQVQGNERPIFQYTLIFQRM